MRKPAVPQTFPIRIETCTEIIDKSLSWFLKIDRLFEAPLFNVGLVVFCNTRELTFPISF